MLIQCAVDRLENLRDGVAVDWVDVTWQQCARRAMRARSRGGRDLRIIQQLGHWLRHEDVLWRSEDGRACIALNLLPGEVLVGEPRDAFAMARLGYELGDLHVPVEIAGRQVIAPADGPVEAAFDRAGVAFALQKRRFQPTCRSGAQVIVSAELAILRTTIEETR